MPNNFQKGRLKRLCIVLNLILNNGLNNKLKYLANSNNPQGALTHPPNKGVVPDNHKVDSVVPFGQQGQSLNINLLEYLLVVVLVGEEEELAVLLFQQTQGLAQALVVTDEIV